MVKVEEEKRERVYLKCYDFNTICPYDRGRDDVEFVR